MDPPFFFFFFNSSLLWDVFIINSVKQLQTWPKTQSEIDISPFCKNTKTLDPLLHYIKGKQLWSSESWIFNGKKNKKYKNPITSNIHACTPSTITHLDVYTKTIYKSVVFCAIGEVFATRCFTFNYRQRYQEKITLFLPHATGSRYSSLYLSFWNTNYQYQFIDLRKCAVFKLKKIETGTGNLYFRTIVGFITNCAISANHHQRYEFELC